jgi:GT2 family glycosyltransferase
LTDLPLVSIVVPTRNRVTLLRDCLDSLARQDYPASRFEIVVVDDGSTDATPDAVAVFRDVPAPRVRYVRQELLGLNAARNAGIAAACGDPVCLVDDDVDAPAAWLRSLLDGALRRPEAGALGGPVRLRFEAKPPRVCARESWARESEQDYGPDERTVPHLNGCNLAVRRSALARVGPFDERLSGPGDETEWEGRLTRAGITMIYVPSAWLWHRRTRSQMTVRALVTRRFRQGSYRARYARHVGEEFSPGRLWLIAKPILPGLAHALGRGCVAGILETAWRLGLIWGAVRTRDESRHRH